jgi:hypothetical protein
MKLERYVPNRRGMGQILKSDEVRVILGAEAAVIAGKARMSYTVLRAHGVIEEGVVEVYVDTSTGPTRARAAIIAEHPAVPAIEDKYHVLAGAVGKSKLKRLKARKRKRSAQPRRISIKREYADEGDE